MRHGRAKSSNHNEAGCRRDALRGTLLRPRSRPYVHMGASCVLAAHSRSAPRPTSVIVIRALRERLAVLAFAALVVAAIVGGALGLGYLVGKLLL